MTPAQKNKYWWEWGKVRGHLLAKGLSAAAAASERHALHVRALGQDKSSAQLTNAEFDRVIAAFRAVWDDANFGAQMRQQEQPDGRASMTRARIEALLPSIGVETGRGIAYLNGMAARIFGDGQFYHLDDTQLYRLEGILKRRVRQIHPPEAAGRIIAAAGKAQPMRIAPTEEAGNPF
ncbi:MAG: DUF1018 domain-containing protein [Opitutaceae bacterium]|nr:DUF1018 domain-containing protein [Opitutaceae bacterium]